jgi:stress-induced morphogen
MPMPAQEILNILKTAFPEADIELKDLNNDQNHYGLKITSVDFKDKTRIQQHQLVYKALGPKMGNELHALALTTQIK